MTIYVVCFFNIQRSKKATTALSMTVLTNIGLTGATAGSCLHSALRDVFSQHVLTEEASAQTDRVDLIGGEEGEKTAYLGWPC